MERNVIIGGIYHHFKDHFVKVKCIAHDSENENNLLVIYDHLPDGIIWARQIDMFLSEVDHDKYPDVKQLYRFELVESDVQLNNAAGSIISRLISNTINIIGQSEISENDMKAIETGIIKVLDDLNIDIYDLDHLPVVARINKIFRMYSVPYYVVLGQFYNGDNANDIIVDFLAEFLKRAENLLIITDDDKNIMVSDLCSTITSIAANLNETNIDTTNNWAYERINRALGCTERSYSREYISHLISDNINTIISLGEKLTSDQKMCIANITANIVNYSKMSNHVTESDIIFKYIMGIIKNECLRYSVGKDDNNVSCEVIDAIINMLSIFEIGDKSTESIGDKVDYLNSLIDIIVMNNANNFTYRFIITKDGGIDTTETYRIELIVCEVPYQTKKLKVKKLFDKWLYDMNIKEKFTN